MTMCMVLLQFMLAFANVSDFGFDKDTRTIIGYSGSDGYVEIPDTIDGVTVTSIGDGAFFDSSIRCVNIPDSVTSIGNGAFARCDSLEMITIPNSVTSIGDGAFECCANFAYITLPERLTSIGDRVFANCSFLQELIIPGSVTSIGNGAFARCGSLDMITIPNSVTSIGDEAFVDCSSLQDITIPNSVTSIGDHAFANCQRFTDVRIPNGVTSIGPYAFAYCSTLTKATFEGNAPSTFGTGVFKYGNPEFKIYYHSGTTGWTNPWNGYKTVKICMVQYEAGANGDLSGGMSSEIVYEDNSPVRVPTPVPHSGYRFKEWQYENGNPVTPTTETITDNITFTAIFEEIILPNPPNVTGDTLTNNKKPTWSWSSGGNGGNGTYRYKLDDGSFSTVSNSTSYTPDSDLVDGSHVLYVQESNAQGDWSESGSFTITIDTTKPTIVALSPVDDAIGVGVKDNLQITFDENVAIGTGNITIKQTSDDTEVEKIDVTTDKDKVSVSDKAVTIDPDVTFTGGTDYYVQIDGAAFKDMAGNSYAGITDTISWNFTPELSNDTSISSASYTINGTQITNVPYGTSKNDFKGNISKGQNGQTWDDSGISDLVQTGDTLVVTAEDGTIATYTIKVKDPKDAVLSLVTAEFDKKAPIDVEVGVTLNNATTVNDVKQNGLSIGSSNYSFSADKLIVDKDYLSGLANKDYQFSVEFDVGNPAILTITVNNKPSSGGSSSGSSGSSRRTKKLTYDKAKDEADKVLRKIEKQSPEDAADAVEDLIENINDLVNDKKITSKEAEKLVERAVDAVNKLLTKEDLTLKQAKNAVNDSIYLAAKLLDIKDIQKEEILEDIKDLVEQVMNKVRNIEGEKVKVEFKDKEAKIYVNTSTLEEAVENVKDMSKDLAAKLKRSGMEEILEAIKPQIIIEAPKKANEREGAKIELPVEALNKLAENKIKLVVKAKGVKFTLPPELMRIIGKNLNLQITAKDVKESQRAEAMAQKEEGLKPVGNMHDLDISLAYEGTDTTKPDMSHSKAIIEIPLADIDKEKVDIHKLGIYVYDEETNQWEYVKSKVVGDKLVFEAPHFSIYAVMEYNKEFKDIQGHWAKEEIAAMAAKHIAKGKDKDNFAPNDIISRAEFTALIVRVLGLEGSGASRFSDVKEDKWYYNEISLAADAGIAKKIHGSETNIYAPEKAITREQMITMIARAHKILTGEKTGYKEIEFTDKNTISPWNIEEIRYALDKGLVNGFEDNTLRPQNNATRAEAVVMIMRLIK